MLLGKAEEEFRLQLESTRRDRRDRWHTWCVESLRLHNGKLWRWIKEGSRPVPFHKVRPVSDACEQQDACLPALPAGASAQDARIREVERWWWDLWLPGTPAKVETGPWLANLPLSTFPGLTEVTGVQLQQVIKRTPKAKAPGADSWSYQDLQDWPLPM